MPDVPDHPSPQTRTTVTARITAHIKQGWPQLDEPVVTHRGLNRPGFGRGSQLTGRVESCQH